VLHRVAARARGVASLVGLIGIVAGVVLSFFISGALYVAAAGFVVLLAGTALTLAPLPLPERSPVTVAPPVRGRWVAANSPASKVPSHGTHGYGQTYAIDLVYEPAEGARPVFGAPGPGFRRPSDFPAFGEPVYAPAAGVVVAARDGARDHRSRSNWTAYAYMLLEGSVRELGGTRSVLGNHVVLDLGDGVYAALAHLRRGSVSVRAGDRVRAGQEIARCGNSGNSSEPHLHFQLMDHPRVLLAAGLPFGFGSSPVPANEEAVVLTLEGTGKASLS
jgi:murein DD-endopeptidase MepM/ murein hydrolase activator NlpD